MDQTGQRPVILVGVGGSGASMAALAWAAREARRRDWGLRVMRAWRSHPARASYAGTGSPSDEPTSEAAATERLAADVRAALGGNASPGLEIKVVEGAAARVLAEASADADLLVLGSGHQSPVAQPDPLIVDRPVGPVIRACLSHARCPVVIISPAMAADLGFGPVSPPYLTGTAARA
ncbi:MAG TPA: universal stress protein [Streptosporangiaceae bacterium]|nr:universal stress protein [Streptosporangiaceae bacterium]